MRFYCVVYALFVCTILRNSKWKVNANYVHLWNRMYWWFSYPSLQMYVCGAWMLCFAIDLHYHHSNIWLKIFQCKHKAIMNIQKYMLMWCDVVVFSFYRLIRWKQIRSGNGLKANIEMFWMKIWPEFVKRCRARILYMQKG